MAKSSLKIIGFCCQNALNSLDQEQDLTGRGRFSFEPAVQVVQVPCSSKVETLGIIKAFESGVDGIFVLACAEDKCHLLGANRRARKIVNYTKELLQEIGIESRCLKMFQLGTSECRHFDQIVNTMTERIER